MLSRNSSNELNRLITASIGLVILKGKAACGYVSEPLWEYISPTKEEFARLKDERKAYLRKLFGY